MLSITQDMEDQKAIGLFEAAEAYYVETSIAEHLKDVEDQKAIAFLEAAEAYYVTMFTGEYVRTRNLLAEIASSTESGVPDGHDFRVKTKPSDDKQFPLMKLPLELRTMVYHAHLLFSKPIALFGGLYWSGTALIVECGVHDPPHRGKEPIDLSVFNIWRTSKTVYLESQPIFFRHNAFRFENLTRLSSFLTCIGPTARRNLASVSMVYQGRAPARAMKLLKQCIGLRHLTIEISPYSTAVMPACFYLRSNPQNTSKMIFGLPDLLKLRGLKRIMVIASPDLESSNLAASTNLYESLPILEEALQVLKQPHKSGQLTRQNNKDYPQKATRTVFGKANVKTRAETKLTASKSNSPDGMPLRGLESRQ